MTVDAAEQARLHEVAERRRAIDEARSPDERAVRALSKLELIEEIRIEIALAVPRLRLSKAQNAKVKILKYQRVPRHRRFAKFNTWITIIGYNIGYIRSIPADAYGYLKQEFWMSSNGDIIVRRGLLGIPIGNVEYDVGSEVPTITTPPAWWKEDLFVVDPNIEWRTQWGTTYTTYDLDTLRGLLIGLRQLQ